eukprot:RCo034753
MRPHLERTCFCLVSCLLRGSLRGFTFAPLFVCTPLVRLPVCAGKPRRPSSFELTPPPFYILSVVVDVVLDVVGRSQQSFFHSFCAAKMSHQVFACAKEVFQLMCVLR